MQLNLDTDYLPLDELVTVGQDAPATGYFDDVDALEDELFGFEDDLGFAEEEDLAPSEGASEKPPLSFYVAFAVLSMSGYMAGFTVIS